MMTIPRIKRIMGEDPAVERYSLVATEIAKAPRTMPMISGRAYCTVSAWCMPSAPAVSRTKQAIQIAILAGFPKYARAAATSPHTTPASASFFFESDKLKFICTSSFYSPSLKKTNLPKACGNCYSSSRASSRTALMAVSTSSSVV